MSKTKDILDVATKLFIEKGIKGTSIQSIADACGISKGAVYLHFKSKNDIILAIHKGIEKDMLETLAELMDRNDVSGVELLKLHIQSEFTEILESKALQQSILTDSGFEMSNELLMWIQECRHRWQQAQEKLLLKVFGEDIKPWAMDLCLLLDGVVQEYSTYMLLENAQFDIDPLVIMIAEIMDATQARLLQKEITPVTTKETLPGREQILALGKERKAKEIKRLFSQLEGAVNELAIDDDEKDTLESTLVLLKQQIEEENPNKVLIRALLAGLRTHRSLKQLRQDLAAELDVELV